MMEEARANRKSFLSSTHSYSLREPRLGKKVRPILPREAVLAGRGRCVLHLTAFEASLSLFRRKVSTCFLPLYFEMEKKSAKLRDFFLLKCFRLACSLKPRERGKERKIGIWTAYNHVVAVASFTVTKNCSKVDAKKCGRRTTTFFTPSLNHLSTKFPISRTNSVADANILIGQI